MIRLALISLLLVLLVGCDALLKPDVGPTLNPATAPSTESKPAETATPASLLKKELTAIRQTCKRREASITASFTEKLQACSDDRTSIGADVMLIGQVEYADIMPLGLRQKARIDTGAETTSVGAINIEEFERDGRKWVKFGVALRDSDEVIEFKAPLLRTASIKRHNADNVQRPVVQMRLAIGGLEQTLEVTLADRSDFEFPVLIGRNFLDGRALVDVSKKFLAL